MTRVAAAFLAAFLIPASASALTCAPKERLERLLQERHGEELTFQGRQSNGDQLLLYANGRTGGWTLLLRPKSAPHLLCPISDGGSGILHLSSLPET